MKSLDKTNYFDKTYEEIHIKFLNSSLLAFNVHEQVCFAIREQIQTIWLLIQVEDIQR